MEVAATIHPVNQECIHNLEEVNNLIIPLLQKITIKTQKTMDNIEHQLKFTGQTSKNLHRLRQLFDNEILSWTRKVKRLGAIPITIGQVKFVCEDNIYYWQYGEEQASLEP